MSFTYLQAEGVASSEDYCWDTDPCALLSSTSMQEECSLLDKEMEYCQGSQSGMMSQPLMESHGKEKLMCSVEGSHAKTSAVLEKEQGSQEREVAYGKRWHELYMRYNLATSSLRTHQCLWDEDLPLCSVTLPKWGMMQNGVFLELITMEGIILESGAGFWPTPLKEEGPGGAHKKLTDAVAIAEGYKPRYYKMDGMEEREVFTGKVNPEWAEWLMGWPMGWTNVLQELEMDRFQLWRQQHGLF